MKRFTSWLIGALLLAAQLHAHAQERIRSMQGVTEYRLSNHLQVLLAPNDLQTQTYANLVVKAGSAVEGYGEGGMAHLLEHMMFKGTPQNREPTREFGNRAIRYNGTTRLDYTNYFASMGPDQEKLHWYLSWLADASVNSLIAPEDLATEMPVVRNEFERGKTYTPGIVQQTAMGLAFPNHGYGRAVIGLLSTIENVPIENLRGFYKKWYRPDNMVLVVSGKFDAAAALAHIQATFGALKNPSSALPNRYVREPVQEGEREALVRKVGTQPYWLMSWRSAPYAHPDAAALDVIAYALANDAGGRFKKAIEQAALGTQVFATNRTLAQYGTLSVGLNLGAVSAAPQAQELLLSQIDSIIQSGVTAEELSRAQTDFTSSYEQSIRSAEGFGNQLAQAAGSGDWRLGFWYLDNLRRLTTAQVQQVAQRYLVNSNRVRVMFIPDAHPVRSTDPLPVNLGDYVSTPPPTTAKAAPALARFDASFAQIDQHMLRSELTSGLRIALLPRPAAGDVISGTLNLHWGNLTTLRGWGIAPYFGQLMLKGSTTRTEAQIQDELKRLQSQLAIDVGASGMTVRLTTTRANWPAFAALMTDVIRHPKFDETAFRVWQQERIAQLTNALDDPWEKARNAQARALSAPYAADDPRYVASLDELLARWQALKVEDIRRFWQQFVGASVAEFAASGAMDAAQVQTDISAMLGDWRSPEAGGTYQRLARPLFEGTSTQQIIPTPDKPNGLMLSSHQFALDPWAKRAAAMELANGILGRGSSSRLFRRVRQELGLSYSVGSWFDISENDHVATFTISGTFAPRDKVAFQATVQKVLQEVREQGLSSVELFFAKRVAQDMIKQGLASDAYLASEMASALYQERLGGERRNAAWYEAKQAMLQDLTIEEVDAAAKQLAESQRWVSVFAGNF